MLSRISNLLQKRTPIFCCGSSSRKLCLCRVLLCFIHCGIIRIIFGCESWLLFLSIRHMLN